MQRLLLVGIMCLFFVLYVGMEVSYGLYIATFAVESQLNLSKSDGAFITAIFWGCFAAMRFVAIFAAVKMRPIYIMIVSFAFCLLGAVPLAFWAETSPTLLKVKPFLKLNKKNIDMVQEKLAIKVTLKTNFKIECQLLNKY